MRSLSLNASCTWRMSTFPKRISRSSFASEFSARQNHTPAPAAATIKYLVDLPEATVIVDKNWLGKGRDDLGNDLRVNNQATPKGLFTPPPDNLPKSPGAYREWLNAIRGGPQPRAGYEFEQKVVEALLLGCIAVRTGTKLEWDTVNKRITSLAEGKPSDLEAANALLNPPARAPWKLEE